MPLTDKEKQDFAEMVATAVLAVVPSAGDIDPEQHRKHHEALERFIERENRRAEFREKIKAQVGGWVIIAALGTIGGTVWYAATEFLKKLSH